MSLLNNKNLYLQAKEEDLVFINAITTSISNLISINQFTYKVEYNLSNTENYDIINEQQQQRIKIQLEFLLRANGYRVNYNDNTIIITWTHLGMVSIESIQPS